MAEATFGRAAAAARGIAGLELGLLAGILAALALKLQLVFRLNVNWDEFLFLSLVHKYENGALASPLQTFHVHFFGWLGLAGGNEVDQVVAARLAVFLLALGSCLLTYRIGRLFLGRPAALFAVLCYLSLANVVEHGTSFRADPFCAFLFLAAVYILLAAPGHRLAAVIGGLCLALALLVSIKSAFYLPTIGAILLWPLLTGPDRARAFGTLITAAAATVLSWPGLYLWHRSTLAPKPGVQEIDYLGGVAQKMILPDLVPRKVYLVHSFVESPVFWTVLLCGVAVYGATLLTAGRRRRAAAVPAAFFLLTFVPLLFYRNAFPYFYVFIVSPAVLFCGMLFERPLGDFRRTGQPVFLAFAGLLAGAIAFDFAMTYTRNSADQTAQQRALVEVVHRAFPEPVPYIDRCSMIAAFPKVGFFMSSWGIENYRAAGRPIMRDLLIERQPVFLLANRALLDLSATAEEASGPYSLFPEDFEVLKENFVHHWGILYVAGKRFEFGAPDTTLRFEILIPGVYTLEAERAVRIDGTTYRSGELVTLDQGRHRIASETAQAPVTLRWGEDLYAPPLPASDAPIFTGL